VPEFSRTRNNAVAPEDPPTSRGIRIARIDPRAKVERSRASFPKRRARFLSYSSQAGPLCCLLVFVAQRIAPKKRNCNALKSYAKQTYGKRCAVAPFLRLEIHTESHKTKKEKEKFYRVFNNSATAQQYYYYFT